MCRNPSLAICTGYPVTMRPRQCYRQEANRHHSRRCTHISAEVLQRISIAITAWVKLTTQGSGSHK